MAARYSAFEMINEGKSHGAWIFLPLGIAGRAVVPWRSVAVPANSRRSDRHSPTRFHAIARRLSTASGFESPPPLPSPRRSEARADGGTPIMPRPSFCAR